MGDKDAYYQRLKERQAEIKRGENMAYAEPPFPPHLLPSLADKPQTLNLDFEKGSDPETCIDKLQGNPPRGMHSEAWAPNPKTLLQIRQLPRAAFAHH